MSSAYDRSSVNFRPNSSGGIHRFSRRNGRANDKHSWSLADTAKNGAERKGSLNNDSIGMSNMVDHHETNNHSNDEMNHFTPIEHHFNEHQSNHPIETVDHKEMNYPFSQITMSQASLGEGSLISTAGTMNTCRSTRYLSLAKNARRETPSKQKCRREKTPRRDKRARIQLAPRSVRKFSAMPPPHHRSLTSRSSNDLGSSISSRSFARGATAIVAAAMTPLRYYTSRLARKQEDLQPSPLERRFPNNQETNRFRLSKSANNVQEDEMTKTSCSTYDPNPIKLEEEENVVDNAKSCENPETERAETTSDTGVSANAKELTRLQEILSQIQTAQRELNATKILMEKQRSEMEKRHQDMIESQRDLNAQRDITKKEMEVCRNEIMREKEVLECQKREISQLKISMEQLSAEFNSNISQQYDSISEEVSNVKNEAKEQLRQSIDESKAWVQHCGKVEVEAIENEGEIVRKELTRLLNNAKHHIWFKLGDAPSQSSVKTNQHKVLDKKNVEPTLGNSQRRLYHNKPKSSRKTESTTSDNTISHESCNEGANLLEKDQSFLNNFSFVQAPLKRTPPVQKKPTKAVSSAYSVRAVTCLGNSVSTTPLSRKTTPRIQNSYSKSSKDTTKSCTTNIQSSDTKLSISIIVNGKKYESSDVSSALRTIETSLIPTALTKNISSFKASKSEVLVPVSLDRKRSNSEVIINSSPRRSKRLKALAPIPDKLHLESSFSEALGPSRPAIQKEMKIIPPIMKTNTYDRMSSPNVSVNCTSPDDDNPVSPSCLNDKFLGKSVVLNPTLNQDISLDGCESIVQNDVGPLSVPWGARSRVVKTYKTSYTTKRKRERKHFSFAISSIFDFKF